MYPHLIIKGWVNTVASLYKTSIKSVSSVLNDLSAIFSSRNKMMAYVFIMKKTVFRVGSFSFLQIRLIVRIMPSNFGSNCPNKCICYHRGIILIFTLVRTTVRAVRTAAAS